VRRRWLLLVPAGVLAAGAGAFGLLISRGGRTTEVSVEEAVVVCDVQGTTVAMSVIAAIPAVASTVAAPTPLVIVPQPGVCVYAGSEFDSVDALTGARHDYPAQTTVTITAEGCGVRVHWDTVRARWDEWQWSPIDGGIRTLAYRSFHESFGASSSSEYQCVGDPLQITAEAGTTWRMVCPQGDSEAVRSSVPLSAAITSMSAAPG
jgi:hypothetical protein